MHHFDYRHGVLHAEAVNLVDLAKAVGTPFYCYSTATLERHYRVFAGAFADVPSLVCYAVKANSNQAVIATLARLHAIEPEAAGLADYGRPSGRMAQVSGLVVTLDPTAPVGRRIVSLSAAGSIVDPDATYTVASNNFLYDGGNRYGDLARGRTLIGRTDGQLVANAVMAYIRANAPLPAPAEGRILVR